MSAFSLAVLAIQTPGGGPMMDLETTAYNSTRVMEIGIETIWAGSGTASQDIALGRAANTPVPQFSMPLVSHTTPVKSSYSQIAVLWTTAPTVPTNFFRRSSFPGTTVNKLNVWRFPAGLTVGAASSLVMWGFGAANTVQGWWMIDE